MRSAILVGTGLAMAAMASAVATTGPGEDEFPPWEKVSEGYTKVISTADGARSLYDVWIREKDGQLLAELPKNFEGAEFFIVPTVAGGDSQMGVYSIWHYLIGQDARHLYWKRYDDKLALVEPNLYYRSNGDDESKAATERVYTDRIVLSTPIVAMGPNGGPVIDLDRVLLHESGHFFGNFTRGADFGLTKVTSAKAFPYNIEISFEFPRANGQLATIHYSIGDPPKSEGFEPREADRRVGFYYTDYIDRSKNDGEGQTIRYAYRWHLEKRDPDLKLSPPTKPIVYYIEHTTPVRYRRWVRDGILAWNKAFERVGISNAIEVRQQDAKTGAYMDIDPEDIRYSFVRWTNSHMGFAIGPVHVHPDTGEIYEADIVMDEVFLSGWIRDHLSARLASAAMMSLTELDVAWLDQNPDWDPRYRLADPADQPKVLEYRRLLAEGRAEPDDAPPTMRPDVWSPADPALAANGAMCACMPGYAASVQKMRTAMAARLLPGMLDDDGESAEGEGEDESLLDGLPESFVGPLLRDVIMHEVGHTMGLMHNWKGSSAYPYEEINSTAFKGVTPINSTVMDYAPANIIVEENGLVQGDYAPIDIGPYDLWAIEWGYTFDDHAEVAKRCAEPCHAFSSEEGQSGPDPHAKTWDLGENSLAFCESEMRFVKRARSRLIDFVVEDGKSWEKAREVYEGLLWQQMSALSVASNWIGGAYTNKYHKGDPNAPDPIVPVDVERQRQALRFIVDYAFNEEAFGLDPAILAKLGTDNWPDSNWGEAQDWPIHDRVLGIQASALTMIINPTKLRRIQDNELRVPAGEDALTVPEVLQTVREAVWPSVDSLSKGRATEREPMLSTIQRNLQREHLDRLIDLATGMEFPGATGATLGALAREELRAIRAWIDEAPPAEKQDAYTRAHLADAKERIDRALEAAYVRRG